MSTYQAHDATAASVSDSHRKLARLQLPADMRGMRFLDIGCNEGFFCNIAAERHASVVGIDIDEKAIEAARTRYGRPEITFLKQSWKALPEGPFDVVLWASAMHYEPDPKAVLQQILSRLTPSGLLILECGVVHQPGKTMIQENRPNDTRWYPTIQLLEDVIFQDVAFRRVAGWEAPKWDRVPRTVFHCKRALPLVLLIRGRSRRGKTFLAARLSSIADKRFSTDRVVEFTLSSEFTHGALQQHFRGADMNDLESLYHSIDEAGLTDDYAKHLTSQVAASDRIVVIEGYITDPQAEAISRTLASRAVVWDVNRLSPPPDFRKSAQAKRH